MPAFLSITVFFLSMQAPPGLKKNLLRTYESWTPEQINKKGNLSRAHSLFCLAWFHAVCQERRNYIPQVIFYFISFRKYAPFISFYIWEYFSSYICWMVFRNENNLDISGACLYCL